VLAVPLSDSLRQEFEEKYLEQVCKASFEIKGPTLDFYHDSDYNDLVPQYGHAIGHAVEHLSWSGPDHRPSLHGEAFSLDMRLSAEFAAIRGVCGQQRVDEHYEIIGARGLRGSLRPPYPRIPSLRENHV
jgi:3-dehydroquinate synthase